MPSVGYNAVLKASGAAVAMTAEPCTVNGQAAQITDTAKRIIDPATAVVVKDATVTVDPANYTVNYLFGIVTFIASYTINGAVTVDGAYLPTYAVAEGRALGVACSGEIADVSVYGTGAKLKLVTLVDFALDFERLAFLDDIDTVTGGTQSIESWLSSGAAKVIDVLFATGGRFRGFVRFAGEDLKAAAAGAVVAGVKAVGAAQAGSCSYAWGS